MRMKILTVEEIRALDRTSIEEYGIPGTVLMENAGIQVVKIIKETLCNEIAGRPIAIFAGGGNNGGDGFVIARHLANMGAVVRIYLLVFADAIKGDARINFEIIKKMNLDIVQITNSTQVQEIKNELYRYDLFVDAIFGTGINGPVKGYAAELIKIINSISRPIIAVDLPSGLNANNGKIEGPCINADKTVTFALPKIGLTIHPGINYTGELIVADIGIPSLLQDNPDYKHTLITTGLLASLLPNRASDTHKGSYGRVFIIAGSREYTGAAILCSQSAMRCGAGIVTMGIPESMKSTLGSNLIEEITVPLNETADGTISIRALEDIYKLMEHANVLAFGPGISQHQEIFYVLRNIIEETAIPLVLDADALNILAKNPNILNATDVPIILTPHPGEMARLTGLEIEEVNANRIEIAREMAKKWEVIIVLKGSRTVVADEKGNIYINPTGNPGMATAGSGDVLTGIIASLIAQGLAPIDAAVTGVYLHGLAGDMVAAKKGQMGLIASDIVDYLPYVLKEFEKR